MKSISSRLLLLLLVHVCLVASQSCYSPDGTFASDNFPCFPNQDHSFCCRPGYACLSNFLCHVTPASPDWRPAINQSTKFSRYGCTDPTWRSPQCPSFCRAFNGVAGEGVDLCNAASGAYCCTYSTDDSCTCLWHNEYVLIANATVVTIIPSTMTGPSIDPSASFLSTRAASRSRTSSSATSSASPSSSSSSNSSPSPGSSGSGTPSATVAASSSTAVSGTVTQTSGPNVVAIAVGVVVPVVVIAALIIGLLAWRHYRIPQANDQYAPGMYMGEYRPAVQGHHQ